MPTVTITWDDINDNEDGFNIYRDTVPLDTANPANLPAPLATVAAGIGTYDDTTAAADTTYYYAVAATKGTFVNAAAGVQVSTAVATGPDFSTAQVGDEVGGGVYAGTIEYGDGRQYHLVFAKQSGEIDESSGDTRWKVENTDTSGASDVDDGVANVAALEATGLHNYPAAQYCRSFTGGGYTDWYLPARDESEKVNSLVAAGHPDFSTDLSTFRWTSTIAGSPSNKAYEDSYGGTYGTEFVARTYNRVRPVRRVPV